MKTKKALYLKDFVFKNQNWRPHHDQEKTDLKMTGPVKVKTNSKSLYKTGVNVSISEKTGP